MKMRCKSLLMNHIRFSVNILPGLQILFTHIHAADLKFEEEVLQNGGGEPVESAPILGILT